MSEPTEIPLPPAAEGLREVIRVFARDDGHFFAVRIDPSHAPDIDPGCWGLVLVDLAHHVANCLVRKELRARSEDGSEEELTHERILEVMHGYFEAEWRDRTDEVRPLDH